MREKMGRKGDKEHGSLKQTHMYVWTGWLCVMQDDLKTLDNVLVCVCVSLGEFVYTWILHRSSPIF